MNIHEINTTTKRLGLNSKQTAGRIENSIMKSVTGARTTVNTQALTSVLGTELSYLAINGNVYPIAPKYKKPKNKSGSG